MTAMWIGPMPVRKAMSSGTVMLTGATRQWREDKQLWLKLSPCAAERKLATAWAGT